MSHPGRNFRGVVLTLLLLGLLGGLVLGWLVLEHRRDRWAERWLAAWRAEEVEALGADSLARSRAVLRGRVSEQLAPVLPQFGFSPADARFVGSPVDFVVFDGLEEVRAGRRDRLHRIVLVDVKTGSASLSTIQRRVRDCVEDGRVTWQEMAPRG